MKLRLYAGTIANMPGGSLLAVEGWLTLANAGLVEPTAHITPAQECLVVQLAENGRDYIDAAVMTFDYEPVIGRMWICLSFVKEEHRGKGLYRMMYAALRELALQRRCRTIESGVHENNTSMRQVSKRMGRRAKYSIFVEELEPQPIDITPAATE